MTAPPSNPTPGYTLTKTSNPADRGDGGAG